MYSTRLLHLFFLALSFVCVAHSWFEDDSTDLTLRQVGGGDGDVIPSPIPGTDDGDDADGGQSGGEVDTPTPSADEPTSTSEDVPTSTDPGSEPTSTDPEPTSTSEEPTSDQPTETPTEQPETPTSTTSDQAPSTTPPPETTTTSEEDESSSTSTTSFTTEEEEQSETTKADRPVVTTTFETVTRTNDDGSKETLTTSSVTTTDPEPQDGSSGDSDGLPENTRNIIIGVVVGIGGAILLGALGVVAWRIRSRRKAGEESDNLMEYNGGYASIDKGSGSHPPPSTSGTVPSSTGRSPFQSTLDEYHQPGQVNTSSNF